MFSIVDLSICRGFPRQTEQHSFRLAAKAAAIHLPKKEGSKNVNRHSAFVLSHRPPSRCPETFGPLDAGSGPALQTKTKPLFYYFFHLQKINRRLDVLDAK
ncbi:hypothetical protein [Cloacibacillus porcorum]|jgi:hypothetical protein|uniref:hypothetical protein n=1 Tax=Cloacibacillus porcorum TaxID=1197717 RepID=UPI003F0D3CC9